MSKEEQLSTDGVYAGLDGGPEVRFVHRTRKVDEGAPSDSKGVGTKVGVGRLSPQDIGCAEGSRSGRCGRENRYTGPRTNLDVDRIDGPQAASGSSPLACFGEVTQ